MPLISDWRRVARRAHSIKLAILTGALAGAPARYRVKPVARLGTSKGRKP